MIRSMKRAASKVGAFVNRNRLAIVGGTGAVLSTVSAKAADAIPTVADVQTWIANGTTIYIGAATLTGLIIATGIILRMSSKVGSKR